MRIFLWHCSDQVANVLYKHTLTFAGDVPNGIVCECPFCDKEITITNEPITNEPKTENCPVCKADLIYPRCDW
jgi:hypothetical protein